MLEKFKFCTLFSPEGAKPRDALGRFLNMPSRAVCGPGSGPFLTPAAAPGSVFAGRVLDAGAELRDLLVSEYAVVFAEVTGLGEELARLVGRVRGHHPHALAHALVALAVLLDALLDLALRRLYADAVALGGLRTAAGDVWVGGGGGGGGMAGLLLFVVQGGGEAEVVGGSVAFFEAAFDLYDGLLEEDQFDLEALENLKRRERQELVCWLSCSPS